VFTNQRATTSLNRPAYRFDYAIDRPHSSWHLSTGGEPYTSAYGGQIWIDRETSRVLRVEMSARDVPVFLQLDSVISSIRYAFVKIGDGSYLLPSHSTDFTGYRKYSADTHISFDDK
jgi:hypothetical protein